MPKLLILVRVSVRDTTSQITVHNELCSPCLTDGWNSTNCPLDVASWKSERLNCCHCGASTRWKWRSWAWCPCICNVLFIFCEI